MRKFIITAIGALAITGAVAGTASADVPRYQSQTATFTMTQPANEYNQWSNVWTHNFTVATNPCDGTFSGTGHQFGDDANGHYESGWKITGAFNADNSVDLTATRDKDGLVLSLDNAPMGNDVATAATLKLNGDTLVTPEAVQERVSVPVFTNTSNFKNHGDYVKSQGGGSDAAHSCIGMPINSTQGK